MRYNIIAFFILIAMVLSAWIASAEEITTQGVATKSADELWTEAERAYREGEFAEAVVAYEAIIAQGMESAELYYNLGNAYFKQNNLGRSILFYNRAQLLNPSDEDVHHNLMYARTKTKDNIQQLPEFFFVRWVKDIREWMSSDGWAMWSLLSFVVAVASLLIYLLMRSVVWRKVGFYMMSLAVLIFITTTLFAASSRKMLVERDGAVVMSGAVSVKSSPDKNATELFVLHEGTELKLSGEDGTWCEVQIADGRTGWIEQMHIEKI
jgi:hypothetical protein